MVVFFLKNGCYLEMTLKLSRSDFSDPSDVCEGAGSGTDVSCLIFPLLPPCKKSSRSSRHVLSSECGLWWRAELVWNPGCTTPSLSGFENVTPNLCTSRFPSLQRIIKAAMLGGRKTWNKLLIRVLDHSRRSVGAGVRLHSYRPHCVV